MSLEQQTIGLETFSIEKKTHNSIILSPNSKYKLAWMDLQEGFQKWQLWLILAYQDIKIRYRRSVLGPFWLTLSMAVTVYSLGYLYSFIFRTEMQQYYPYLVAGMLSWSLISMIALDCTDGITCNGLAKQMKLPYTLYIHRIVTRNFLIFFHNLLVMIPIFVIFSAGAKINEHTLLLVPALLIIYVNSLSFGMILAMVSARYNDMSHVIKNLIQVSFFITPVMWSPEILKGNNHFIVDLNPCYAFLECIREPLLGKTPTLGNLVVVLVVTVIGFIASVSLFIKYRARIIYWL